MNNSKRIFLTILSGLLISSPLMASPTGPLAPDQPRQIEKISLQPWHYKKFQVTPVARYHIQAVVLSKHNYWSGSDKDKIAPYDLALGWGPMSDFQLINQLKITQTNRWYDYRWENNPPAAPDVIKNNSSNHHIIPGNESIAKGIKNIQKHELIELDGYLVNLLNKKTGEWWNTSLSRSDEGEGACELFWVTDFKIIKIEK